MKQAVLMAAYLCALCLTGTAAAADRALLIGIGRYASPGSNLSGIDLDVAEMEKIAALMGFGAGQVRVLRDEQASKANIVASMQTWLVDGVGPNDRVLFYYSGHGTHFRDSNGDEPDGQDEALVPYDATVTSSGARNFLLDEELAALIGRIPSRNVLVLIDACHSGTATRTLSADPSYMGVAETQPKFLYQDQQTVADKDLAAADFRVTDLKGANYVAIAASRDDETAMATPKGSVFTLGVAAAIRGAISNGQPLTPKALRDQSERFVAANLAPSRRHHPQVGGDPAKFDAPLPLAKLINGPAAVAGTRWVELRTQVDEIQASGGRLTVTTNRAQYRIGELVEIGVEVPAAGYLNVVTVDANDNTTVLFPNQYHRDNRVRPGRMAIPTPQMPFTLPASEPAGDTLVVAFFSSSPVNWYDDQVGGRRSPNGEYAETFAQVSGGGMRAISVAAKQERSVNRAGGVVVRTVR